MDVTDVIGHMGKIQKKILIVLLLRPIPGAFLMLSLQTGLIEVDHWCSRGLSAVNISTSNWKEYHIPREDHGFSKCDYFEADFDGSRTNRTLSCDQWDFDQSGYYQSMRQEWNLVCHRGWYVGLLYLFSAVGNFVSYVPAGYLADRFGRKPMVLIGTSISAVIAFISAFATSVEYMLVCRFFIGFAFGISQNSLLCLFLEAVGPSYRSWIIFSFGGAWGLAVMIVGGITYFISDWRITAQIAAFPVHLPVLFLVWKLVPESARWLLTVKKYDKAEKLILQLAKENGVTVADPASIMVELKKKVEMDKEQQGKVTFLDLLKDKNVQRTTIVLYISFILTVFNYHGYYISVGQLGGSLHLNLITSGGAEIISLALFFTFIKYSSKRKALLITFVVTGIFYLLTIPCGDDVTWLRKTLAMLGMMFNTTSYNLLYVFANEIFPTCLRVIGVSGGMSFGRIGSFIASFADDLGRIYGRSAPITLFGVVSLITSVIFLLLPENKKRHLPDTLAETKQLASGKDEAFKDSSELTQIESS